MPLRWITACLWIAACLLSISLVAPVDAQLSSADETALSGLSEPLRNLLRDALPATLYEGSHNWGKTSPVPHALHWKGLKPRIVTEPRNDGVWRRIKVTSRDLPRTLVVRLSDLRQTGSDKMTFKAYLSFQAGVTFDQWIWESGVRLYSGGVRARMRVHLPLECEALVRLEPGKTFLPDAVLRLRVVKADLHYDHLVVEHIAGIGGTGAKLVGEALHSSLKFWRPSLERDLLAKANAAIVKAGDTREIRLSLSSLLKAKKT